MALLVIASYAWADAPKRVKFTWSGGEAVAELNGSPSAESLWAILPVTVDFKDFNGVERIGYTEKEPTRRKSCRRRARPKAARRTPEPSRFTRRGATSRYSTSRSASRADSCRSAASSKARTKFRRSARPCASSAQSSARRLTSSALYTVR